MTEKELADFYVTLEDFAPGVYPVASAAYAVSVIEQFIAAGRVTGDVDAWRDALKKGIATPEVSVSKILRGCGNIGV